jgi:hypothetical protein
MFFLQVTLRTNFLPFYFRDIDEVKLLLANAIQQFSSQQAKDPIKLFR